MKLRKHLSADELFKQVRKGLGNIEDHRPGKVKIGLQDALMSGFAMFSLKDPSLLEFDKRRAEDAGNLRAIYGIETIPSDTGMREILDDVNPEALRPLFKQLFYELKRGRELGKFRYMGSYYVLSLDGTSYFSSKEISCESCLQKRLKNGDILYHHQLLGAAIVHPDCAEVIPLMPEAIIKQDGVEKNDCERNAGKRFFEKLRKDHPRLKLIITEDGLSSNAPHIQELKKHDLRFVLGAKESDHAYLFARVREAQEAGDTTFYEMKEKGLTHRFHFGNKLPLNASNQDVLVNFLEYWEIGPDGTKYFSWVTDFIIMPFNCYDIMRGGRVRWKSENENFNTLKNQGYHLEHNFGHGNNNLSVIFALLMMLAFLVDQAQQIACPLFQAAWNKAGTKSHLWEKIRGLFGSIPFQNMETLFRAYFHGYRIDDITIFYDSG